MQILALRFYERSLKTYFMDEVDKSLGRGNTTITGIETYLNLNAGRDQKSIWSRKNVKKRFKMFAVSRKLFSKLKKISFESNLKTFFQLKLQCSFNFDSAMQVHKQKSH